jgi:hypothetical protein
MEPKNGRAKKLIRVFPRKTAWTPNDNLSFVGNPPLFRPPEQPVHISVSFTWDIQEGKRLYRQWSALYKDVRIGGPAFDDSGGAFVPGRYLKKGPTITSRGCIRKCKFCFVPDREGNIRELPIQPGNDIADNNLLACSRGHVEAVFDMLKNKKQIRFSGGLDSRLLKQWHIDVFKSLSIKALWFACDTQQSINPLKRAADLLADFSIEKKRCYVLIGHNGESIYEGD